MQEQAQPKTKATAKQQKCGTIYPYNQGDGTHLVQGCYGHEWKFMWHHPNDGEPQARKCTKCGYSLFFYQCTQKWGEISPFSTPHLMRNADAKKKKAKV